MKKISMFIVAIGSVSMIALAFSMYKFNATIDGADFENDEQTRPYDGTYVIGEETVVLKNGLSEITTPDSSFKITTRYFGNDVRGDFDHDGTEDIAFLISQETGGSGTFYYVVARVNTPEGPLTSPGILLGDRIAPQTTEFRNSEIIVNYADREPGEPMTTRPSLGVSRYFTVTDGILSEIKK